MTTDNYPGQRFHQAAIFDNDGFLVDLLAGPEKQNIDAPDRFGRTPVYTAVSNNSLRCLKLLLEHGADPNRAAGEQCWNMTPLHAAVMDTKLEAVQLLLEHKADINVRDAREFTPLTMARSIDQLDIVKALEEMDGKRKRAVTDCVRRLCEACKASNESEVQCVLSSLQSVHQHNIANMTTSEDRKTPLCYAVEFGTIQIVKNLLSTVDTIPQTNPAPIHLAVNRDRADIVELLLQKCPECCRWTEDQSDQLPLHLAAVNGFSDVVQCLLHFSYPPSSLCTITDEVEGRQYQGPFDINALMSEGKSALHLACEKGHSDVVDHLLQYKVAATKVKKGDLAVTGENGFQNGRSRSSTGTSYDRNADFFASGEFESDFHPVKVNTRKNPKSSCIYAAVKNGDHLIVQALMNHGANVNLVEVQGGKDVSSLLLLACENNDILMMDKLLQKGAEDRNNYVLKEAVKSHQEFIPQLLKYKSCKDEKYVINKNAMKESYMLNTGKNQTEVGSFNSVDPNYKSIFPTNAVNVRWKNLEVLSSVAETWLIQTGYLHNQSYNNHFALFSITRVDISNNALAILPSCLLQLPSLYVLNAARNQISQFPSADKFTLECKCLEDLYVNNNKLEQLPAYLFTDLPALKSINASSNQLKILPNALWVAQSLHTLDISDNELQNLPKPEQEFWSEDADRDQSFEADQQRPATSTDQPRERKASHVTDNDIRRMNHWTGLVVIDEGMNSAENQKKGLKVFKASKNKLTEFPDFLSCCAPLLDTLEMSKNKIKSLGKLGSYPKLMKTLDLSENLIEDMSGWKDSSSEDDRSYCSKLSQSTPGLFTPKATKPVTSCGHRNHTKLENLETFNLSNNKLTSLCVVRDRQLTESGQVRRGERETASTWYTSSTSVMQEREEQNRLIQDSLLFPNVTTLELGFNQIVKLPGEIGEIKPLKKLSLKKNPIRELPPQLGLLTSLWNLEIELCPIEGYIQDLRKASTNPTKDICGFLHSVLEESEEYNSMNLMIVGSYRIGKTSLLEHMRKLGRTTTKATHFVERVGGANTSKSKDGDTISTVGIDLGDLALISNRTRKKVQFKTWDFGGQKEYYATHQYFLNQRSLYLVVWNLTTGEQGVDGLRQWLVNIQAQAPGAPVVVVGTHLDEVRARSSGRRRSLPADYERSMVAKINDKYNITEPEKSGLPRILGIVNVGCPIKGGGLNIDRLVNVICEKVFELNHPARKTEKLLGHKVPKKYIILQRCIQELAQEWKEKEKEPVLDQAAYTVTVIDKMNQELEKSGMAPGCAPFRNKEDLHQASKFLHENGVLCHFEDQALKDQYFIDPQWLCDQLAQVVSVDQVNKFARDGIMDVKSLDILYRKSNKIQKYILSLLNKFEVALQFDSDHLILPSLLPTAYDVSLMAERGSKLKQIPVKKPPAKDPSELPANVKKPLNVGLSTFYTQTMSAPMHPGNLFLVRTETTRNPAFSYTRLYVLTYFPSGFWPRLITRILSDDQFYNPLKEMFPFPPELMDRCPELDSLSPTWRCWQTGLELVQFDTTLLQVKEVPLGSATEKGMCDYSTVRIQCFLEEEWTDLDLHESVLLEISFPTDMIRFHFGVRESSNMHNLTSIETSKIYLEEKSRARILAKVVEHVDSLLQDWYPEIGESRFIQNCAGRYLVTRVIPCPLCLEAIIKHQNSESGGWEVIGKEPSGPTSMLQIGGSVKDGPQRLKSVDDVNVIYSFLVERCIQNVFAGKNELCKRHNSVSPTYMTTEEGLNRALYIAPDVIFHDLDKSFLIEDENLELGKVMGKGAFGKVCAGKLFRGTGMKHDVAVKILYGSDFSGSGANIKRASQMELENVCLAYLTARQEISILQTIQHPHIVPLLGLCTQPLSLLLSLAPRGALADIMHELHKDSLKLESFVIRHIVVQVADALDYLHKRRIIYRDLKSDNILVWHLPSCSTTKPAKPTDAVMVKLADYGISRPVLPGGAKGYGGTPPFIAPEILQSAGRDTYTEKVDIFSFGMFMFELLTCRTPLEEINNPMIHVCHGGRPSLTTEEALYPSHMLDLMAICWAHEVEYRPSADQVRQIAACPQFCHLCDAVSMETNASVLAACSVYVQDTIESEESNVAVLEDHTQVWISTAVGVTNFNLEVLSYDKHYRCVGYKTLALEGHKILAMCEVKSDIWCIDNLGNIHIYSNDTLTKSHHFPLHFDGRAVEQVHSMFHYEDDNDDGHVLVVIPFKHPVKECLMYDIPEDFGYRHRATIKPINVPTSYAAAVTISDQGERRTEIWLGQKEGTISIRCSSNLAEETASLNHFSAPNPSVSCRFIVTSESKGHPYSQHSVWTYNYPGSIVYRWDTLTRTVVAKLDSSSMVPSTETYKVHANRRFEAKLYQVTAITVYQKYCYISTTWGCVIVADAKSLQPFSIFRCHGDEEFYVKAIVPLGPTTMDHVQNNSNLANEFSDNANGTLEEESSRGIVTIGRGYNDSIRHVTQLEKQALVRGESESGFEMVFQGSAPSVLLGLQKERYKSDTFILSWYANGWEYY